jgi:hypothetical protein
MYTTSKFQGSQHGEASKQCNINAEIMICDIATYLQPSDQEVIWTIDLTSSWGFVDRDLEVTRTFTIGMAISRYEKLRCNRSRRIKLRSGPLI